MLIKIFFRNRNATTSLREKVEKLFEKVRSEEFPKTPAGCDKRRWKKLCAMNEVDLSEDEKYFLEYTKFVANKRRDYLIKKRQNESQ